MTGRLLLVLLALPFFKPKPDPERLQSEVNSLKATLASITAASNLARVVIGTAGRGKVFQ